MRAFGRFIQMANPDDETSIETLREIEQRVLWLATRIVDAANTRVSGHSSATGWVWVFSQR